MISWRGSWWVRSVVPVNLVGVFSIGPERYLCALLEWEERHRFIPLWLPPMEGATLAARLDDWAPRRPDTHDALAGVISHATEGVSGIEITTYNNGTFFSTLSLGDGTEVDMRTSDALVLALMLDVQVEADEAVVQQCSLHLSPLDAHQYFGLDLQQGGTSAGSDADAAGLLASEEETRIDPEEFEDFMRKLGIHEDSFDEHDSDDE